MARGSSAVVSPNLGLYLGRPPLTVPSRALQDGLNFRIKEGRISTLSMGWLPYSAVDFQGPISLIDTFSIRGIAERSIIGTPRDLFVYDPGTDTADYINPIYATATVDVTSAANAVVTPDTGTPNWVTNGIKAGDFIHFGSATQNDPTATWYEIGSVDGEGQLTLIGAVTGAPLNNTAYTIRRTFTGTLTDPWDTEIFVFPDDGVNDDQWFATNGVDTIVYWDGSAAQVSRATGLGFTCKSIVAYKNMMLYAGITSYNGDPYPSSIINSDIGKPLAAGDAGTGVSEQFRIHDGVDAIIKAEVLGDNAVFYGPRHIVLGQFVGGDLTFIFRIAVSDMGPIGSRLIANFGDYHQFIAQDGQYLFDGVSANEVGKHVWREVLSTRDASRFELGFHHFDEEKGELLWFVPLTTDAGVGDPEMPPEYAFVEHYLEEVGQQLPTPYSKRQAPFSAAGSGATAGVITWDELTQNWDQLTARWNDSTLFSAYPITLVGDGNGTVHILNSAQDGNGTVLPNYVKFGRRLLGDSKMRGLLKRVYPYLTELLGEITVRTFYSDHASGSATILQDDLFDLSLPQEGHFVSPFRCGRFFEVQIGSSDGLPWELDGYDVDVAPGGRR